jgi:hypothetical protein
MLTDKDHRIKNERMEIITGIFAECCRYPNVYIEAVTHDWGACFQFKHISLALSFCLTNEELYIGKKTCKYSDYYVIGNSIRDKLGIPEDTTLGIL